MSAQTGIHGEHHPAARFLMIRVTPQGKSALKEQITAFYAKRHVLARTQPYAGMATTLAFGKALWQELYTEGPEHFLDMPVVEGEFPHPAVPADLMVYIASTRVDLCFELADALVSGWEGITVVDECSAFRFHERRDLTGFIDGIENPVEGEESDAVTLLPESTGACQKGSFVFAQRFVHDLKKWQSYSVEEQQKVMGRTKWEGEELDDASKPATSHIARVDVGTDILRFSLPYGSAGGEKGLFFFSFTNDLAVIDEMLKRMYGLTEDGLKDRLLEVTKAVGGNYFFAPPQDLLDELFDLEDI
ncbi:Dyp-type peroxidase [Thiofilum flexile]|uniref:Dyp-type peroxidase n=1 Tax=Thiofilum flexile TaxID=125627 RepID=UPI000377C765|nr:Dyp-type peroxidase [Thiofilum flexile]